MYCPKCAQENPDDGSFCRKCGTDLSVIAQLTSGRGIAPKDKTPDHFDSFQSNSRRKKETNVTWEGAISVLFGGIAFLVIAIVLAFEPMGAGWWFWMLIPGFFGIGAGLAMIIRITQGDEREATFDVQSRGKELSTADVNALPPKQTTLASEYSAPRKHIENVTSPSVAEETTRRFHIESEGETTKLEKD